MDLVLNWVTPWSSMTSSGPFSPKLHYGSLNVKTVEQHTQVQMRSEVHRIIQAERDLGRSLVQPPAQNRGSLASTRLPRALASLGWMEMTQPLWAPAPLLDCPHTNNVFSYVPSDWDSFSLILVWCTTVTHLATSSWQPPYQEPWLYLLPSFRNCYL